MGDQVEASEPPVCCCHPAADVGLESTDAICGDKLDAAGEHPVLEQKLGGLDLVPGPERRLAMGIVHEVKADEPLREGIRDRSLHQGGGLVGADPEMILAQGGGMNLSSSFLDVLISSEDLAGDQRHQDTLRESTRLRGWRDHLEFPRRNTRGVW